MENNNLQEIFYQNLRAWENETYLLSVHAFNSVYFQNIIKMGKDAVPFLYEEIKKSPTHLVHALDLIFPDVVDYKGFVSLQQACDKWVSILEEIYNEKRM